MVHLAKVGPEYASLGPIERSTKCQTRVTTMFFLFADISLFLVVYFGLLILIAHNHQNQIDKIRDEYHQHAAELKIEANIRCVSDVPKDEPMDSDSCEHYYKELKEIRE